MAEVKKPIRLAMREEGDWWVAYVATTQNMDGAHEIGRIKIGAAKRPAIRRAFLDVMVATLETVLGEMGLQPIGWAQGPAPEHERSGRA